LLLYENFEKRGVVEKRGEEEMKSMPHAPVFQSYNSQLIPYVDCSEFGNFVITFIHEKLLPSYPLYTLTKRVSYFFHSF
jgi:hypothetical protein